MKPILFFLTICTFVACKTRKNPETTVETGPIIALQTGPCMGFCPVYSISIQHDGNAVYEGQKFVVKNGTSTFKLEPQELSQLMEMVKSTNVWQYPESFKTMVADAPMSTLTVYKGETLHSVRGNFERPQPLLDLEAFIKKIATNHGIDVNTGVDPNAVSDENKGQVMVLLKDGVNAGNWIMQFSEIKLNLVRRAGTLNKWLVAYDKRQISEAQVLDLFKGMEDVIDVTPQR